MRSSCRFLLTLAAMLGCILGLAYADEPHTPILRQGDTVAFVGGEDLVALAEDGSFEWMALVANPGLGLHFRSLAWEGDTVYEQPRDLNYPTLEDQLQRVGATVVLVQFGLIESLAGREKIPEFIAAYEKLLDRLAPGDSRRVVLLTPGIFEQVAGIPIDRGEANQTLAKYREAIVALAERRHLLSVDLAAAMAQAPQAIRTTRDGLHLSEEGRRFLAVAVMIAIIKRDGPPNNGEAHVHTDIFSLIREKNRLWFNYYRPQNWAFLAGDRTSQPSSRDHIDPTKRWFPAEMELYLPLIEAKEREIAAALK
jgi:lysophospholipase L1-like esterase